jgi:hypothetical protein
MRKMNNPKRKSLSESDFVFPASRKYPIENLANAREALSRSSGKPEHDAVVAAVRLKYPDIDIEI